MFDQQDELQERRLQHQLEIQSMQIETVLNRHQLSAHIDGGTVKPRSISFNLQSHLENGLERLRILKNDLMYTLGVAELTWSEENGRLQLHITKPEAVPVSLLDLMPMLPDLPPVTAVLGLAEDGRPVLLNFGEKNVTHILITGTANAGKTSLLRTLAISMAMNNRQSRVQFVVLDVDITTSTSKKSDLQPLNYLPHMLTEVMCEPEDVVETLAFLQEEVDYRLANAVKTPTILVLIDKVVSLLEDGNETTQKAFTHLMQRGAEVGIHLIMTAQRTHSAVLNPLLRANISLQIVGQVADAQQAKAATALDESQAEFLLGEGDFLAVAGERVTHFQAAYIGDYDLHMTLQELYRKRPPALLAHSLYASQPITLSAHIMEDEQSFGFDGNAIHFIKNEAVPAPNSQTLEIYEDSAVFDEDEDDEEIEVITIAAPSEEKLHFEGEDGSKEMYFYLYDDVEDEETDIEDEEEWEFDSVADVTTKASSPVFSFVKEEPEEETAALPFAPSSPNWGAHINSYKALKDHFADTAHDKEVETEEKEGELVDEEEIGFEDEIEKEAAATIEEEIEPEYEDIEDDWLPFDDE